MLFHGAENALMSGSGPTVFGLFSSKEKAEVAYRKLKKSRLVKQVFLTGFFNNCT
jgi:4-diphosphocytidyl-2-C-methyl-D-erythritol kinase